LNNLLSNLINRPRYETSSRCIARRKRTLYVFLYVEIEIIIKNSFQPGVCNITLSLVNEYYQATMTTRGFRCFYAQDTVKYTQFTVAWRVRVSSF